MAHAIVIVLPRRTYTPYTVPLYVELKLLRQKLTIQYRDQGTNIPKIATQDTTLTVNNVDGGKTTFPVPSGTEIGLHVAGLHYNRIYMPYVIGTGSDEAPQHGIGRSHTSSCQSGSLGTGQRTRLFHLVKV